MSDQRLAGRVIILTGAAGLLGRQYSTALSLEGAHVVAADINYDRALQVAASLPGAEGLAVEVDVADPASVKAMVERVVARFNRIDALVNNAARDPKFDRSNSGRHTGSF